MAKIESSYININRLNAGGQPARGLRSFDGSKVNKHRRAYVNNGVRNVIVYDELRTTFITPDDAIHIGAAGGSLLKPNIEDGGDIGNEGNLYYEISDQGNIQSFSIDAENLQKELPYFLTNPKHDQYDPGGITNPNSISPNKDTKNNRTYTILARQEFTGAEANITVIQDKEIVSEKWGKLSVDESKGKFGIRLFSKEMAELGIEDWEDLMVHADGKSEIEVQVYAVQQKIFTSSSGENDKNQTHEGWISVASISGNSYKGGALNKWDIGYIGADNLGTNPTNGPEKIYDIKEVSFMGYDGENYTWNIYSGNTQLGGGWAETVSVYQERNKEEIKNNGQKTYKFSIDHYGGDLRLDSAAAERREIYFTSKYTQKKTYTYTSGASAAAPDEVTNGTCTAYLKGDSNQYASLDYTDSVGDFVLNISANEDENSSRTITLIIRDASGVEHELKFTQPANEITTTLSSVEFVGLEFEYSEENPNGGSDIWAGGSDVYITVKLMKHYNNHASAGNNAGSNHVSTEATGWRIKGTAGSTAVTIKNHTSDGSTQYISFPNLAKNTNTHTNTFRLDEVNWTYKEGTKTFSGTASEDGTPTSNLKTFTQEQNTTKYQNKGNATYVFNMSETDITLDAPAARNYELSYQSYTSQPRRLVYASGAVDENATALVTNRNCTMVIKSDSYSYAKFENDEYTMTSNYGGIIKISANTNQNSGRNINLYVDDYNGNRHNIKFTQPQDTWITRLSSVSFKNLIVEFEEENINKEGITTIPASGGTVKIYASLNRTYSKISQATGTSMGTTSDTTTADKVEIVTGYKYGNVTAGNEYDYVYITYPNLGSNTTTHNNNYELSSIKWTLGDKSDTYDRGDNGGDYLFNMSQEQNVRTPGTTTYAISVSSSKTDYSADKAGAAPLRPSITVTSTKTIQYSYTSGYWDSSTQNRETVNNGWTARKQSGLTDSTVTASGTAGTTSASAFIAGNTSTTVNQKTTFRFTAAGSSATYKDITFTQAKDAVSSEGYGVPVITGNATVSYMQEVQSTATGMVAAAGGRVTISVPYKQSYSKIWYSGSTSGSTTNNSNATGIITGTASTAKDINGKTAQLAANGQSITMGSAGNITYSSDRTIYTISSYKVTVNGKTSSARSHSITIKQQANQSVGSTYDSYAINLTYNNSGNTFSDADDFTIKNNGLNHNNGYHRIKVASCTRKKYNTYTSGYKDPNGTQENTVATISVSLNNSTSGYHLKANASASLVQTLDVNAGSEFLFVPSGNTTSSNRVFTVYGKCKNDTSVQDTIKFTQSPASYAITVDPEDVGFGYGGGSTRVTVEPSINESVVTALPTVSSKPSWVNVDMTNWIDDSYALISVGSNGGGTESKPARSGNVVFAHPQSSNVVATLYVGQSGYTYTKPETPGGDSVTSVEIEAWEESYGTVGYQLYFDGTIMDPITIKVQDSNDEWSNVLAEKSEDGIPFTGSLVGNIYVSNPVQPMYVHAYLNGKNIGHGIVK